jgi:hypothetical protein
MLRAHVDGLRVGLGNVPGHEDAFVFLIGAIIGGAVGASIGYNARRSSVKAPPHPMTFESDVRTAAGPWITQARRVPAAELMLQKQLEDILEALRKLGFVR